MRKIVGHQMNLVTPGIRPAGAATGDQKRIMTPARAIAAGADYLVVGRPITEAADPKAAADAIQAEIKQALGLANSENRRERRWQRDTGSRASMFTMRRATRPTSAANPAIFKKFGGRFVVRGGKFRPWKVKAARATS